MDINLEKQIINSLLEFPENIDKFSFIIKPHHFSDELKPIYSLILELANASKPISASVLSEYLSEENQEILIEIISLNPIENAFDYIPELQRRYKLNEQEKVGLTLIKNAKEGVITDLATLQSKLLDAPKDIHNLTQWSEKLDALPNLMRYKTGVSFLDFCFGGGFEVAQLVLLSGEPEAGKTSLGLQILENIAENYKACFFCFEFTARAYITRKKELKPKYIDNFGKNLYIINDGYDIHTIADNIKAMAKEGVKFFLIDSQMRIEVPKARSMEEEESTKFSTLARLAHSLEILIVLIIQTAKGDSNNPMGSKKGGHESSITIRIEHCKPDKEEVNKEFDPKKRTIIIKKNKQTGKHFKEEVRFDPVELTFKRLDNRTEEKEYEPTQPIETIKI